MNNWSFGQLVFWTTGLLDNWSFQKLVLGVVPKRSVVKKTTSQKDQVKTNCQKDHLKKTQISKRPVVRRPVVFLPKSFGSPHSTQTSPWFQNEIPNDLFTKVFSTTDTPPCVVKVWITNEVADFQNKLSFVEKNFGSLSSNVTICDDLSIVRYDLPQRKG